MNFFSTLTRLVSSMQRKLQAVRHGAVSMSVFAFSVLLGFAPVQSALAAEATETAATNVVAGHVAFVNGQVSLAAPGKPARTAQTGEPVFVGDHIQTQANSHVHLRMVDNAFLALRPSSQMVISAYQYDKDQPQASRIRIDLEQGTSRAVSGKGGQAAKNQYRFNTPLAAIGLRGTDYTVLADDQKTRVSVAQGGVIVSPIGPHCLSSQLGPCFSPLSRELSAGNPNTFIEIMANQLPKILQKQSDAVPSGAAVKTNLAAGLSGDTSKPDNVQQTIERKLVSDQVRSVDAATDVSNQSGIYESIAKWGRWSSLVQLVPQGSDNINKVFAQIPNFELVDSNAVFALAYPANTPIEMPKTGQVQFSLVAGEAYVKNNDSLSRVGVKSGQLGIDFGQNTFVTQVSVATGSATLESVKSQGTVDRLGRMTSNPSMSNATLSGVVLNKGSEATYLFDKSLASGGLLSGVVQWAR